MAKKPDKKSSPNIKAFHKKAKKKRTGIGSKKRTSNNKKSKHYKKLYRGQGR
jgi:hypothetical protein